MLESASPVCLDTEHSDAVIPTVHQRQVILPEWMTTVDLEPSSDVTTLEITSEMPSKPEITQTLDRDVVKEVVTQAVQKRKVLLPYVPVTEDGSEDRQPGRISDEGPSADSEKYAHESRMLVEMMAVTNSLDGEQQKIERPDVEAFVGDTEDWSPEDYIDTAAVKVSPVEMLVVVDEDRVCDTKDARETVESEKTPIITRSSSVQHFIVVMETLYQYVLQHKSMIFIYSAKYKQFNFVLENFLEWLIGTLKKVGWMRPVSWRPDEIRINLQQIKVFSRVKT